MKIEFWIKSASVSDVLEIDDDLSEDDLTNLAADWANEQIDSGWRFVDEVG
jgi:hypothetical protein